MILICTIIELEHDKDTIIEEYEYNKKMIIETYQSQEVLS